VRTRPGISPSTPSTCTDARAPGTILRAHGLGHVHARVGRSVGEHHGDHGAGGRSLADLVRQRVDATVARSAHGEPLGVHASLDQSRLGRRKLRARGVAFGARGVAPGPAAVERLGRGDAARAQVLHAAKLALAVGERALGARDSRGRGVAAVLRLGDLRREPLVGEAHDQVARLHERTLCDGPLDDRLG
jgi:hypothetical protein